MKERSSTFRQVAYCLAACILLFSCYTAKRADKDLDKVQVHYPEKIATYARDKNPCVTVKVDTVALVSDSLVYVDCPDNNGSATEYAGHDTIYEKLQSGRKTITIAFRIPVKTYTITKVVEDSAKIKIYQLEVIRLNQRVGVLTGENIKLESKVARRGNQELWLLILVLVSVGINIIQFKIK